MGPNETYKLLQENHKQNKKTTYRLGEKHLKKNVTNKGLISKIYRQLIQLNIKKYKLIKKYTEGLNRHFSKENIQMVNRHMQRCSTLLIIRKKQIRTIMREKKTYSEVSLHTSQNGHYQKVCKLYNTCWRGCEKKGTHLYCWWEFKLVQPLCRTVWRFLKKLKIWTAIPLPDIYVEKMKALIWKETY